MLKQFSMNFTEPRSARQVLTFSHQTELLSYNIAVTLAVSSYLGYVKNDSGSWSLKAWGYSSIVLGNE